MYKCDLKIQSHRNCKLGRTNTGGFERTYTDERKKVQRPKSKMRHQTTENKHIAMEAQGKVSCSVASRHLWSDVAKKEKTSLSCHTVNIASSSEKGVRTQMQQVRNRVGNTLIN